MPPPGWRRRDPRCPRRVRAGVGGARHLRNPEERDAWLWKLDCQHRRFNFVGDTTWLSGEVVDKVQTEGPNGIRSEVHLAIQEQTATTASMTSAAHELTNLSVELQSVVSRFKLE